jgi:hypothetical protein
MMLFVVVPWQSYGAFRARQQLPAQTNTLSPGNPVGQYVWRHVPVSTHGVCLFVSLWCPCTAYMHCRLTGLFLHLCTRADLLFCILLSCNLTCTKTKVTQVTPPPCDCQCNF